VKLLNDKDVKILCNFIRSILSVPLIGKLYIANNQNYFITFMSSIFFFKKLYKGFFYISLLAAAIFVINSCKKNIATAPISESKVLRAKAWYESTFPAANIKKNQMMTQSIGGVNTTNLDYTQLIAPYWDKYTSYTRDNKDVVEVPIDSSMSFAATLSNAQGGNAIYKKEYSRTSFLIINDGQNTSAYIMTVIADSSYVKNNLSKLDNNRYNKHDPDFSGVVLYHSPKGQFIKGWFYKNGKILYNISPRNENNSVSSNGNKRQVQKLKNNDTYQVCTDWFQLVFVNGQLLSSRYLDSYCSIIDDGAWGGNTYPTGSGGSDPSDSGGGSSDGSTGTGTGTGTGGPRDIGFPPVDYDPQATLNNLIASNSDFLFDCDSIKLLQIASYNDYGNMYQNVAGFHPGTAVMNRITNLQISSSAFQTVDSFYLQNLNSAFGSVVNSDFFPVKITAMPTGMDMASLTEYFRLNMTNFTSGKATFSPYVFMGIDDTALFNQAGASSVGALVHIGMVNDGTVILSDYNSGTNGTYFKFSTMTSPLDYNHPVSGNREFGIYPDPNNPGAYTFYTMGVDRISDWSFVLGDWVTFKSVFPGADSLWSSMQDNMINFINTHGGHAELYHQRSYTARPDYDFVKDFLDGRITLDQLKTKIGC